MNIPSKIHELLKPLCWIIGEWKSVKAVASYPTMKCPVDYNEKLIFTSVGQPSLIYKSETWSMKDNSPMHLERGFLHIDKDAASVTLMTAQNFGIATMEEGLVENNTVAVKSSCIAHMKFVKQKVVTLQRCYKLNENKQLEYCLMMETPQTPLTLHLSALYEKIECA